MIRRPFCSLLALGLAATASADETGQSAAPLQGEVTKHTFNQSKVFPGTVRDYWIYVPKEYDPAKPACVYINQATRLGIQVCDQAGRVNCIIPTPNGKVANLCFGGPDFQTLFATCGERVFKRKLKVKGANAFEPPIKPAPPRL